MHKNNTWKKRTMLLPKCGGESLPKSRALEFNRFRGSVSVGCVASDKSWETTRSLECQKLAMGFEKSLKERSRGRPTSRKLPPISSVGKCRDSAAFQGLVAEAIVGASDACGEMLHLVKWQGKDELELVPAVFTTLKFPLIVMAFYANRFQFICSDLN